MTDFFIYLSYSTLSLAALYLLYKVSMSYETLHRLNRVLLLGFVALSAVLPLCRIEVVEELPAVEPVEFVAPMTDSVVYEVAESFNYTALLQMAFFVLFLLGAVVMIARLVISIMSVKRIIRSGEQQYLEGGVTLTIVDKPISPFSWFGHIVVSRADIEQNRDIILTHEMAHIRLRHSWDVMAVDLALCFWWFNPAMWLLRRELQSLHEYQADDEVLNSGIDAQTYQLLLIKRAVGSRLHSVANCLNHSNLKKRITMMCKKTSSRWSAAKALLVLPLVAVSLAATATTVYVPREVQDKVTENSVNEQNVVGNENNYPMTKSELRRYLMQNLQNKQNLVGLIYADVKVLPDGKVVMVKVAPASGEKDGMQPLVNEVERVLGNAKITERKPAQEVAYRFEISFGSQENGELVWSRVKASDDAITVVKWAEVGEASTKIQSQKSEENTPYIMVEKMPTFQGGDLNVFRNWVQSKIQYPKEAMDKGIKGRVVCSFVVEKDGSLTDFNVLQSPDKSLGDEVVRILKTSPKWEPGEQRGEKVRVKYTVPIVFSIGNNNVTDASTTKTQATAAANATTGGDMPYVKVEKMPTFQGGDLNVFRNWVQSKIQYPKEAMDKGVKGRVVCSFVVEKDGSLTDFDVLQSPDKSLADEVVRILKTLPKWEPGEQRGEKVRVKYTVPIVFSIAD
ncbi:MAG: M56 family metallopeptidase [Alistipes sp.]|nr:M56 family metallopeptidase [Alistipes sp.]